MVKATVFDTVIRWFKSSYLYNNVMESEDMLVLETSYLFSEGSNPFVINFVRCCFIQEKLNLKTYLIEKELNFSFDYVESELIAFLSGRVQNNLHTTFPNTTGVEKPTISGEIFNSND